MSCGSALIPATLTLREPDINNNHEECSHVEEEVMERSMDVTTLANRTIAELTKIAKDLKIESISGLRKQELIAKILEAQTKENNLVYDEGVL